MNNDEYIIENVQNQKTSRSLLFQLWDPQKGDVYDL